MGADCSGLRPWLGEWENPKGCGEFLQVVQRGASNTYFPHVVSSIYLPLWAEDAAGGVVKALEDPRVWGPLSSGLVDGKISADRCEMVASMRNLDAEDLRVAAQRKLGGIPAASTLRDQSEEEFRRSEYEALKNERGAPRSDLLVQRASLGDYAKTIAECFSHLALVISCARHALSRGSHVFYRQMGTWPASVCENSNAIPVSTGYPQQSSWRRYLLRV